MDGVTALALARPGYIIGATVAAFAANLVLQVLGALAWLRQGVRPALTVGLLTGNRNMGLVLVALGADASFEVIAFFAVAQIPMYVLPGLLAPVYRRLVAS
jgi:BASS family bile acid:Na+ symporter